MFFKIVSLIVSSLFVLANSEDIGFIYNGFNRANLSLDGIAQFTSNGLLELTNTSRLQKGHAFYPTPINFNNLPNGSNFSFSTTFVFAIVPSVLPGHGMAFVIAPIDGLVDTLPSPFLGLFNDNTTGRKRKFAELLEDWELEYGPHRFKYKDLYIATKGFSNKELLGCGGFGRVYRGVLPNSSIEVAVKKVSHDSKQGLREFVAEIVSIGRLRHRNLVPLLGYCRRKGELLLIYEYMSNGSLDKFLYDKPICILSWNQRFRVIKGVASALVYLHEEWEQVVIHRDVKASNVLLDSELNTKLGDFGLARLYDHGSDPLTTHVVGTVGYLAPEQTRTGKATTISDVYAFGAFLLEVACGRRPIDPRVSDEDIVLVDYVFSCWRSGDILRSIDQNLAYEYVKEEVEMVLKLGLVCSQTEPTSRPSMRQVLLYLEEQIVPPPLPELSLLQSSTHGFSFPGFDHHLAMSSSFSADKEHSYPSTDSEYSR